MLDEFDVEAPVAAPKPAKSQTADAAAWAIPTLTDSTTLFVSNDSGMEDIAFLKCPIAAAGDGSEPCCIQRSELRTMSALDIQGNVTLSVRRLRCMTHGRVGAQACSFSMAHPAIMAQLSKHALRISPQIIVLNSQTIITAAAYQCDHLTLFKLVKRVSCNLLLS